MNEDLGMSETNGEEGIQTQGWFMVETSKAWPHGHVHLAASFNSACQMTAGLCVVVLKNNIILLQ